MLREVFRSRMFFVGLLFFVLIVVGGVVYLRYVERETAEDLAGTQERMKPLTKAQKSTPEVPVGIPRKVETSTQTVLGTRDRMIRRPP